MFFNSGKGLVANDVFDSAGILGCGVKNIELATALDYSKPSVHNMLKSLAELGVVTQEVFGLAFFTEEGRMLAQKYAFCYTVLEKNIAEICGSDVASESSICGLLADMSNEKINELCNQG